MTVYDREKYISTAIESVLVQSFEDFELIIVDDCSEDKSLEIARQYESDPRVRIYVNEKNLGDYPNRNYAASLAHGKYIKFLDADDLIYPHGLAIFVADMEAFPEAPFALTAHPTYPWLPPVWLSPHEAYVLHFLGKGLLARSPCGAIIRTEVFRSIGPFSQERHVSDTKLWLELARVGGVLLTDMNLVYWRKHGDQESARNPVKEARGWEIQLEALTHPECPLTENEREMALRLLRLGLARRVVSHIKKGHFKLAWILIRTACLKPWDLMISKLRYCKPYEKLPESWVERFQEPPNWEKVAFARSEHLKSSPRSRQHAPAGGHQHHARLDH
jgi:glycosyltransferase involved in cell wall biosynthesis